MHTDFNYHNKTEFIKGLQHLSKDGSFVDWCSFSETYINCKLYPENPDLFSETIKYFSQWLKINMNETILDDNPVLLKLLKLYPGYSPEYKFDKILECYREGTPELDILSLEDFTSDFEVLESVFNKCWYSEYIGALKHRQTNEFSKYMEPWLSALPPLIEAVIDRNNVKNGLYADMWTDNHVTDSLFVELIKYTEHNTLSNEALHAIAYLTKFYMLDKDKYKEIGIHTLDVLVDKVCGYAAGISARKYIDTCMHLEHAPNYNEFVAMLDIQNNVAPNTSLPVID